VALPVVPKVEFNFEAIMYITIFVFADESPSQQREGDEVVAL